MNYKINNFNQRKKDILSKPDKSSIGKWDEKIIPLCNKINQNKNYYTTSSCSGRIVLMIDSEKKSSGLFLYISHNLITLKTLKQELKKIKKTNLIKFKQEPMILHVACASLEHAKKLLDKSRKAGFKKIGIISLGKNIIVEINGSQKIEFPIMKNKKILVNDDFLKLIIQKSNKNLKKTWDKIKKLEKSF